MRNRFWLTLTLCIVLIIAVSAPAFAGKRELNKKWIFIGGEGTLVNNDASFKMNYMEAEWNKGVITMLNQQISSLKDSRLLLKDVQYLATVDEEQKILWKMTDEDKLDYIIDNLDPAKNVLKVYDRRKFFTKEVPFDLETGIFRWIIEIKDKTYNVDWNMKKNDITYQEVQ